MNESTALLDAERAVSDLLAELKVLKQQVGGYNQAKTALTDVRTELGALIERTSKLADQTHGVITTLAKIGTPELLQHISISSAEVSTNVDKTKFAVLSAMENQRQALSEDTAKIIAVVRAQLSKRLFIALTVLGGVSTILLISIIVILLRHPS